MEIKITTGTYNTSDYRIVKQYKITSWEDGEEPDWVNESGIIVSW